MKTPYQQKLEHFQKSFSSDENLILKSDGTKSTPQDYVKGLKADKFNPSKLKREMEHHHAMAKMTGDAGHMHVYEELSKMHKDHPMHEEGDGMEKKKLAANKSKKTKASNAKKKVKDEKAAEKAKVEGKNVDPKKKDKSKETAVKDKNAKSTGKDKPLKEEEKYSSPEKKEVNGKVDTKKDKDSKHVEVKVVINKSEREIELLSTLGIDIEKADASKNKYGKGKKTVGITVKGKKGYYVRQQVVGTKDQPVQHHINKNSTVGGVTSFGALINNLVAMKVQETGMPKGIIETELAYAMGYGIMSDGSKKIDKYGNKTDVKSNIRKIVQGKSNPDTKRKALAAQYFGHSLDDMADLEGKAHAGEPMKVDEVDLDQIKAEATGFNYDDIKSLVNSSLSIEEKALSLLELGVRNAGKISTVVGEDDPFKIMQIMVKNGYEHTEDDGFDIFALEDDYVASIANKPPEDRFAGYRVAISQLVNKDITLVAAFGAGGVGKTYNAKLVMEAHKQRPFEKGGNMTPNGTDYDYVVIKGRGSMSHILGKMYEHRDKLIIFDDFDSVLKPGSQTATDMANILKAGLDGGEGERWVEHGMKDLKTVGDDVVPDPFKFGGRVLIITNLKEEDMPQPIVDRAVGNTFNLSMSKIERLSLMSRIYTDDEILSDGKVVDVPFEIRRQAFDFMKRYSSHRLVSNKNGGSKITPRTFKGVALKMMNFAQMDEKQLKHTFDPDKKGISMTEVHQKIQDTYLRMLL